MKLCTLNQTVPAQTVPGFMLANICFR